MDKNLFQKVEEYIKNNNVVFLIGNLGSGKTHFFKNFMEYIGCNETINSPTFSIKKEYVVNDLHISHYDLYRDADKSLVKSLVSDDILEGKILFIEWPSNLKSLKKIKRLEIHISEKNNERIYRLLEK
ncbi:MAG: tRNA (adenosine(37)-N6)-threonylcarbamoyltransferase complex ATPase subunit type 1 TsaE [Mycoplasmataceae bacterium]|nr:tRNA (adenosine(37)-N6)-threonylcarbamoyltransferase complex ATPase subunit type 1 TsaE [Mycoplasmataceae bacterium]